MKIRRVDTVNNYIRVNRDFIVFDNTTDKENDKEYLVTKIEEGYARATDNIEAGLFGVSLHHKDMLLGWIPFHAITMVYFEVEDD